MSKMVNWNMNILVLNYEFPPIGGGASPVSYDISRFLVQRGYRIAVVTMGYRGLSVHAIVEGMEIYRVPCFRQKSNVCHPWEQFSYIVSSILFLKRYLKNHSIDIVHAHFIIPTGVVAWYLRKKYGLSYVLTAHGSDVIGHNNKRFGVLYKILKNPWCSIVRKAQAVVSPSKHLIKLMQKSEPNGNYVFIPNGIETSLYCPMPKKNRILVMCRLQETKNVQTILQAAAKTNLQGWQIDIVGDGPYKSTLEQLVVKLRLKDFVVFHGWIENKSKEQLRLLGEASVFVSASKVENCPVSVLEALCAGCKVVVSDIPGHRELLQSYGNYFMPDDTEMCAKQLQEAMMSQDEITEVKGRWDWKVSVERYEEILMENIRS